MNDLIFLLIIVLFLLLSAGLVYIYQRLMRS